MAVSKKVGKQSAKGNAKVRRPSAPVKVKVTELNTDIPVVVQPVIPEIIPEPIPTYTEPVLTEVDSNPTPKTVVMAHKGPTMRGVLIGTVGAGIAGYFAYTGLKSVFLDKGFNQAKSNQYALISAGVIGLVTFGVLYSLTKKTA